MPAIAELYATVMPETSQIADGIVRAFREVDPKAAEAGRRWGREIQRGLGDTTVELKADTAKAKAEIDEASRKRDTKIQADADTAKAEAQIDLAARDRKATIEVDADTLVSSVQRSMSQAAPAMAGVGAQLGQSLTSAGAKAAPEVGGSLSSAMGPVGTAMAVALVGGAVTAAAGVAAALSGVIGLIPAGLGGGMGVIGTLVTGLDGVKDAWDAAGKAADSSGKDQEEKAKSVASAQRSLKNAVQDEASAQKDVANARKDARQQLEDLNVQLRGGVIDEKQAILDAQAARRDLATGRFKDSIEYQQAALRVQAADQRVLEAHQRNVELQGKATDANAKGVDGSDQVVAANQRLARSQDDVALALQNLADAQKKNSSNADAFALAMGKLSPNAQAFVNTLQGLKPAWEALKFSVQDSLFAGVGPELQRLASQYLPVLKEAMSGLAGTMNTAFKDIGAWLSKPETMAQVKEIVANIGSSFAEWAKSLVPFSEAFLKITQVGSGFLPQLGTAITEGANAFNNFIQQAAKSGELQNWMQTGIQAMGELIKLFPVLGKMFLDLAPIGIPVLQTLGGLLRALEPLFVLIGNTAAAYQTGVNQFWGSMGRLGDKLSDIVKVVWPPLHSMLDTMEQTFQRVFDAISKVVEKAWKIIKPIFDGINIGGVNVSKALKALSHLPGLGGLNPGDAAPSTPGGATSPNVDVPFAAGGDGATLPKLSDLRNRGTASSAFGGAGAAGAAGGGVPSGAPATPSGFNWDAVAQAESSGNWSNADTGHNGHYGGLQFSPATWAAFGGLEFASRPDLATPEQQKIVADRTAFYGYKGTKPQGLGAWETITKGMVPGVTTSSVPSPGGTPMPAVAGLGGGRPGILHDSSGYSSQAAATNAAGLLAQLFPQLTDIGGARPDDMPYHREGRALDVMIPGGSTMGGANPQGKALGDQIKAWALANADALGLEDTIWQDFWQPPGGKGNSLGRASQGPTQGHFDHVHLTFKAGATPNDATITGLPNINGMYPSGAGMPTIASPGGVSPEGIPLGTQQSPFYVMPAQGNSGGEQLGQDFVSGIAEVFGFDGSLFKNPLDSGLFKGFKGLMSFLTGGGKGGKGQGMPASYWQGAGGDGAAMPAMGGGDLFAGLGSMLTGVMPQPFGQINKGGPAQAPDEFQPMLPGSGGNATLPGSFTPSGNKGGGPQIDQSINIGTVNGKATDIHQTMVDVNVPRARQGVNSIPGLN
ncbi:transglycosylase family protein [Mycobacterium colombiense]